MKFAEHLGAHITPEWRKQCKFHNLWFHEFTNQRKFWWIFIYRYTVWRNESQIGNVYSRGSIARISGTRSFNQIFRKIRWSILHILWKRWVIIRSQLILIWNLEEFQRHEPWGYDATGRHQLWGVIVSSSRTGDAWKAAGEAFASAFDWILKIDSEEQWHTARSFRCGLADACWSGTILGPSTHECRMDIWGR